jgi:hypothetical protein
MVLPATSGAPQQLVSAVLGPECGELGGFITCSVAMAIVSLISLAYLWSPPRTAA